MDDVCLILEGTYPYVSGGVSSWVSELIHKLKNTTFSIVYLGAHRSAAKKMHYHIPSNVREFREIYIFDYGVTPEKNLKPSANDWKIVREYLGQMDGVNDSRFEDIYRILGNSQTRTICPYDLVHSNKGWEMLLDLYNREDEEVSFLDYFWTWRFLYLPFVSLLRVELPEARVYHSPSTGYAGLLGCVAKVKHDRPFVLTEHGIYTRERKIDISTSDWIYSEIEDEIKVLNKKDFFKEWWISLFGMFSRLSYDKADQIFTLYEGNRVTQIQEGADPSKVEVIPNGIDMPVISEYTKSTKDKLVVGFVGRVVSIKDVKTLIRAYKIVHDEVPDSELWILGPTDEEIDYFRECQKFVEMNHLQEAILFKGKVKLSEYYPKLDCLVLTSISEGQPLVILEAFSYGLSVVATDVGGCKELIHGDDAEDKLLGSAGFLTPVCNPEATAEGILNLLKNEKSRKHMGGIGQKRVKIYYQLDDMLSKYQKIYHHYAEEVIWE